VSEFYGAVLALRAKAESHYTGERGDSMKICFVLEDSSLRICAVFLVMTIFSGTANASSEIVFSSDVSKNSVEQSRQIQRGGDTVVIEGLSVQPKLKDLPMAAKSGVNPDTPFMEGASDPFALLLDVEKLTGIPDNGFDLFFEAPVVILTPPKGSNR